MWLIVIGVVVVGFTIFMVIKTSAMNNDPRSQELAVRMLAAIAESKLPMPTSQRLVKNDDGGFSYLPPKPTPITQGWKDIAKWLVAETPDKSPGQRTTMMAHSLSMIKPQISERDYRDIASLSRQWDGYTAFFG